MEDLTGRKFGKLTVVKPGKKIARKQYWICKCECGTGMQKTTRNNGKECRTKRKAPANNRGIISP